VSIKYDEYDLLELFGSFPIMLCDDYDVGIYYYSYTDSCGLEVSLNFSVYEQKCGMGLSINNICHFEIDLSNVVYLRKEDWRLRIRQQNVEVDYIICFKPNIFVTTEKVEGK